MKTTASYALAVLLLAGSAGQFVIAQTPGSTPTAEPGSMPEMQDANTKPLASPAATADTILNGKTILVKYNSPAMRGRKIMGELVPYGKVWRTGANPATSFVTAGDIMLGSLRVPAGSYTLYTLPAAEGTPWMLIINKQVGQWGLTYDPTKDLGRVPMQSATLPSPQESMSISFEKSAGDNVKLHVKWETADQFVTITPAS